MSATGQHYKLKAPDGGWGIIITLSLAITLMVTADQVVAFGIVYGNYLKQITNEGSASAVVNGIFLTFSNLVALLANYIIQNHSFRYTGIVGSLTFFIGNVLSIFANNSWQLSITFGVLQGGHLFIKPGIKLLSDNCIEYFLGMGMGISVTAILASFNEYFEKRKNFMLSVAHTLVAVCSMTIPYIAQILMNEYGYRGTVAILAAISLHSLLAVLTLQPVKWHMVKVPLSATEISFLPIETIKAEEEPGENNLGTEIIHKKTHTASDIICKFLLLALLKEPVYVNIAVGCALCWVSDILFISLLPMFIRHRGYNNEETAYIMTVYMISDVVGRFLFSILNLFSRIKTRTMFIIGITAISIFRIGTRIQALQISLFFTFCFGPWIIIVVLLSILGLLRCFIIIPIPLVIVEYAETRFTAAYSLYQVLCAIISTVSGQLTSIVALHTTDTWVQHLLTFQLLLCIIPWIIEQFCYKKKYNK